jgi:hypothetical protein
VRTYEGGQIELINAATGDSLVVHGVPLLSPDGARFVAVAEPEACGLSPGLEIWRVTGDRPVHEYALPPFDCDAHGWSADDVSWRSRDTLMLERVTASADSARRMNAERDTVRSFLVRGAGMWALDSTSTAVRRRALP